jgi:hypothetical protein
VVGIPKTSRPQIVFQRLEPRRQVLFPVRIDLDAQNGSWVAFDEHVANAVDGGILASEIQNGFVHHFDGRRIMLQDRRRGGQRFQQVVEHDYHQALRLRQRYQP